MTGYGVVDYKQNQFSLIACGCIRVTGNEMPQRLRIIHQSILDLITEFAPWEFAIEQAFVSKNAQSALKLGQARGVALCAAAEMDLPIAEYAPRLVKQAIVGTGAATKEQVQHMVTTLLQLNKTPPSDAADALAIAMCHVHHWKSQQRIKQSTRK